MSRLNHPVPRWTILLLAAWVFGIHGRALAATTVTVCTQAELESKISLATTNGGDGIVNFDCDGTLILTNMITVRSNSNSGGVVRLSAIGHSITISGPIGTNYLNGRLFLLDRNVELYLTNITFADGLGTNGGAFYVRSNSALYAVDCVFSNNVVTASNGLAGASARTSTVNGSASDGRDGAAGPAAGGGAIYNLGAVWLSHCVFLTNGVYGGNGGAGGNGGNGTVTAGDGGRGGRGGAAMGGAIYNQGRIHTENCSFYANYVLGGLGAAGGVAGAGIISGYDGRGGAGGAASGGAIFNYPKSSSTNVDTTFALNVTDSGDSADGGSNNGRGKTGAGGPHSSGGAIANFGTNILENCTFFSNGVNAGNGGTGSAGNTTGGRGGNGGSAWGGNLFNGKKAVLTATHCTISDGGAIGGTNGLAGSGIIAGRDGDKGLSRGANVANSNGVFTLRNSIVAYAANGTNSYHAGKVFKFEGRNISSDQSFKLSGVPRNMRGILLTNVDPRLDTLALNGGAVETLRLLEDSPAIRMALTNYGLAFDARGVGRPATTNADLGAYQYGVGLVAPTIVSPPADATAVRGNSVIFTVTAQGDPPLTYQWLFNNNPIANATSSSYVLTNAQTGSEGSYSVRVANNSGAVTSEGASLQVVIPANITRQPSGLILAPGATGSFSVNAEGEAPLSFQWLSNNVPILGATLSVLTIANAQPSMNANYAVRVSNPYRTVVSSAVSLVVTSVPPAVLTSPTSASAVGGYPVSFSASASGTVPMTFLWYLVRDGATNFQDALPSSDGTNTLTINVAQPESEGSYFVVVTNYGGRATSQLAALSVQIIAPIVTQDVEDQAVAAGDDARFSVGVYGSLPLTYQWYSNQTALISGATNFSLSFTNISTNWGGTFSVIASNSAGMITSRVASLVIADLPPTIVTQPGGTFAGVGQDATFTVAATGSRPFTYQWYYDGEEITNATNATLTVRTVDETDVVGAYYVEVANDYGFESSADAYLYLLEEIEVDCGDPNCTITMPGVDPDTFENFYTLQYRASSDDPWVAIETISPGDELNSFEYTPQPFNASSDAYRVVVTVDPPDEDPLIDIDPQDASVTVGQDVEFEVIAGTAEPVAYRWYFNDALLAGETRSVLGVTNVQPSHAGSYYAVVHGIGATSTSAVAVLTVQSQPLAIVANPVDTVVYETDSVTLSVVALGSEPRTYQWYFNGGTPISGATSPDLEIASAQLGDAGSYHVVVENYFGQVSSSAATLTVLDPAPAISSGPQSVSLFSGEDAVLSVTNTGLAPFSYLWLYNGTNVLAGAVDSVLSLTNLQSADEGTYQVVVGNTSGSVTSAPAVLSISNAAPILLNSIADQDLHVGDTFSFSIDVIGSRPLAIQWYHTPNDELGVPTSAPIALTNGTSAILQLTPIQPEHEGTYQAFVTNTFGVTATAEVFLNVLDFGVPP